MHHLRKCLVESYRNDGQRRCYRLGLRAVAVCIVWGSSACTDAGFAGPRLGAECGNWQADLGTSFGVPDRHTLGDLPSCEYRDSFSEGGSVCVTVNQTDTNEFALTFTLKDAQEIPVTIRMHCPIGTEGGACDSTGTGMSVDIAADDGRKWRLEADATFDGPSTGFEVGRSWSSIDAEGVATRECGDVLRLLWPLADQ